jgi:hypothetical protein
MNGLRAPSSQNDRESGSGSTRTTAFTTNPLSINYGYMFTANALHISQELLKVHDKLKSFAYRLRKEEKRVQSYNLSN